MTVFKIPQSVQSSNSVTACYSCALISYGHGTV